MKAKHVTMMLFMYWFAVIDASGKAVISEYRDKTSCEIVQQAYERSGFKTTKCYQPRKDRQDGRGYSAG